MQQILEALRDPFVQDFARWTDEVAVYPATAEPFYLALGIADELGELLNAEESEILKEIGDVAWYTARYIYRVCQSNVNEEMEHAYAMFDLVKDHPGFGIEGICIHAGVIAGIEKKRIRDGANWTPAKRVEKNVAAARAAGAILVCLAYGARGKGSSLHAVLDANMAKLSNRKERGVIQGDGDNR